MKRGEKSECEFRELVGYVMIRWRASGLVGIMGKAVRASRDCLSVCKRACLNLRQAGVQSGYC